MDKRDFLLEIGCAELPSSSLYSLSTQLATGLTKEFENVHLSYRSIQTFATPRRIAALVSDLSIKQAPRKIERLGPNIADAYDKNGTPTLAALGFIRSCGVSLDEVQIKETPKGKRIACIIEQPGLDTQDILGDVVKNTIKMFNMPKAMRWGSTDTSFARPVYWIVMLFGKEIIPVEILGKKAGKETYGHRFHHPKSITITQPKDYSMQLYSLGCVMADFQTRKEYIRKHILQIANPFNPLITEDLLNEVTALVEWPVVLKGQFNKDFLAVPKEVLITAMETHQKCFPIENNQHNLEPFFILVSNIESKDPIAVVQGNERVISARLSDAAFFYYQDLKHTLESRLPRLQGIVFQQQLGSIYDKTQRMCDLAYHIAKKLELDTEITKRAALLSKCDLVSEMVYEFPKLQGIMGYYYALHDHENEECARAIKEHYLPRYSGDTLPCTKIAAVIALADRLDTLIGILGINQTPTGDSDPFALRRCAQGIFRILIECKLNLDLMDILKLSHSQYRISLPNLDVISQAFDFIMNRLKTWYLEQQIAVEIFEAVLARNPASPLDFHQRLQAVRQFQTLAEASSLAAVNKRVHNILKKSGVIENIPDIIDIELFESESERKLAALLESQSQYINTLYQQRDYTKALTALASLKAPIDQFFDEVMVMVDDEKIRDNRLALLKKFHTLMTKVADIALLP